jgi:AcrR family transcriptional regulator
MVSRRPAQNGSTPVAGREPDVAERVVAAAFELFAADGYEATTVEAITARAGMARRTFFRYFRSKEDVIFPDHDLLLAQALARLETLDALPPVAAVCEATSVVFAHYVATPERSVERYRLTRQVPALRAREIASVHAYHRAFTKYLALRFAPAGGGDGALAELRAEVTAGAVIAAHNQVLRAWLRRGGEGPSSEALEHAFDYVLSTFERSGGRERGRTRARDAIVVVVSTGDSAEVLAERIRRLS